MIRRPDRRWILLMVLAVVLAACREHDGAASIEKFKPVSGGGLPLGTVETPGSFSGYTNYWHSIFWTWHRYGNLYEISHPDVAKSILQNKVDIAEELGVPGLVLEEGFLASLMDSAWRELEDPTVNGLADALEASNVLVSVSSSGDLGRALLAKIPESSGWRSGVESHQARARDFHDVFAYRLRNKGRTLFVVVSDCPECRARSLALFRNAVAVVKEFDLHRGWFGVGTLLHSVTCHPGHPLEVIGRGMNEGNDWFTFSGYMDYLLQKELPEWLGRVHLDIVTDVGTGKATHSLGTVAYGCRDWDGLKIQDMPTEEEWIAFVRKRGGYIFRPVYSPDCDRFHYDGYIAVEGNKKQIDGEDVPFILQTGYVREDAPASMVVFIPRAKPLTRDALWEAILSRRAVGILPRGRMLGPERFRKALELLLLDRVFLEKYFGDRLQVEAKVEKYDLNVALQNAGGEPLEGTLEVAVPPEVRIQEEASQRIRLAAYSERKISFRLRPTLEAMGRANPIKVVFRSASVTKRTLALLDLPPAVSVHKLLYGQSPEVVYPVSLHNFGTEEAFPVKVTVLEAGSPGSVVYEREEKATIKPGEFGEVVFRLPLPPGAFAVEVSALGARNTTQLGVEASVGKARCTEIDLNGDGIQEYRMENESVLVTLLPIGARIIEYIVKERGDNILFKLWPEKEWSTDKRPFRERGFYPYGGFEDFLGQASMETHKVYRAEVVQSEGTYVQVKMEADFYGNRLEKTFTLFGDSPLVEVRFALAFRNPEANMLGPQPILELGRRHWTEDVFVVPSVSGRREVRMRPDEYFGEVFFLEEGWNAGRDTSEDVAFVGAFPVSEPEFLHMWMNHPSNAESHHYYAEFQPWVPIFQKTVRYFSYYLWGAPGPWERGLAELRRRNLITSRAGDPHSE